MNIYLPDNIALKAMINANPPEITGFKIDNLKYILSLILKASQYDKSLLLEDYQSVSSRKFKIVRNYRQYIDYLIGLNIIQANEHYIVGKRSKGYRISENYRGKFRKDQITDFSLLRKVMNEPIKHHSVRGLNYLNKWFNEKLTIDESLMLDFNYEEYMVKMSNKKLWDFDKLKKKYKQPYNQYKHAFFCIDKVSQGHFNIKRDNSVGRYHSVLTNMRALTRNAIMYNGEGLVSIDIKNSQPYLSILLLDYFFWSSICDFKKGEKKINKKVKAKNQYNSLLFKSIPLKLTKQLTNIMCCKITSILSKSRDSGYSSIVAQGRLYEYLEESFKTNLFLTNFTRKEIKDEVFRMLFSANRYSSETKKLFSIIFPEVHEVFTVIKSKEKKLLPCLLQAIESYLVIDVIAKRISKEYPYAPIFSIHDSIVTTEKYVTSVRQIMKEELSLVVGHEPTLHLERWRKENVIDFMNDLKFKAA